MKSHLMTETQTTVKAAIMFTDLVGYTALTERDARAALGLVRKCRDLHLSKIDKYNGELLKELGDGFMATFESSLDAILCAREIQLQAKQQKFETPIRIGLHFGNVTLDSGDIFGHGVNTASRIQSIADPGGVYISQSVQESIKNHVDIEIRYMGAVPLKNIKDPVKIYALDDGRLARPDKKRIDRIIKRKVFLKYYKNAAILSILILLAGLYWFINFFDVEKSIRNKSVAVISFENLSDDASTDYLSVSITEELIISFFSFSKHQKRLL